MPQKILYMKRISTIHCQFLYSLAKFFLLIRHESTNSVKIKERESINKQCLVSAHASMYELDKSITFDGSETDAKAKKKL